jgi:hypothetical protein
VRFNVLAIASALAAIGASCALALLARRYARRIDLLKQEIALTRYPASLPRSEKRAIARAIAKYWSRKALLVKGHRRRLIEHYCLEAAKEVSLVYGRRVRASSSLTGALSAA